MKTTISVGRFAAWGGLMLAGILLVPAVSHAATYSMASSTNWNIRWDGPASTAGPDGSQLSYFSVAVADINGDGEDDLLVGARRNDPQGRTDAGSTYVVYSDLWRSLAGTGNILDLDDPASYNIRFDGAAGDAMGLNNRLADLNNDNRADIVVGGYQADNNGADSGSVYVIFSTLLDQYGDTTGNILNIASSTNYNLRYDGAAGTIDRSVGAPGMLAEDINGDQLNDLLITSGLTATVGSNAYIIYNSLFSGVTSTGNNIALATTTSAYNIKYTPGSWSTNVAITVFDVYWGAVKMADIDGNGKPDLILGSPTASHGTLGEGSVYIIKDSLIDDYAGTGNDVSLASSTSNWSIRLDGTTAWPGGCNFFTCAGVATYFNAMNADDLDGDGKADLVFSEDASRNGRAFSGSTYLVTGALLDSYSGTRNVLPMASSTNYNIRWDGAAAGDTHIDGPQIGIADLTNDGRNDLVIGAADVASSTMPGKVYVIFNDLIEDSLDSTGNVLDLADTSNWNIRYDGAAAGDWLDAQALRLIDFNGDDQNDVLMGAWGADFGGADSGSLYVIYYFPHEIDLDPIFTKVDTEPFDVTGTVSAPDNPTHIAEVEWSPNNSVDGPWTECEPEDGTFDSNEEDFVCEHAALASPATLYFRAEDEKGIYTALTNYASQSFVLDSPISDISATAPNGSATVTWTTSEPGSSQVEYGTASGVYTASTTEADTSPRVTSHSVSLSLECRTYYYRVHSKDIADNEAVSAEETFTANCGGGGGGGGGGGSSSAPTPNPAPTSTSTPVLPPPLPGSPAALQAQIAALLVQVQALQARISAQGSSTGASCTFTRNLTLGSTGADVRCLQQFLNAKGYVIAASGAGSPGNETTYFGSLTKAALARFQAANGISPAAGYFGPITRTAVNAMVGS